MSHRSPIEVVQAQLDAYNAKDIEALLATYSPKAEQYATGGELLRRGTSRCVRAFLRGSQSLTFTPGCCLDKWW